ncbi:hypothetical protein HYW20_05635 [Candidatus Woesearchaeota archaeon]|nr:hypothetical protein [Candidatus Woesearchaeota archaeon]
MESDDNGLYGISFGEFEPKRIRAPLNEKEVEFGLEQKLSDMAIRNVKAEIMSMEGVYLISVKLIYNCKQLEFRFPWHDYEKGAEILYEKIKKSLRPSTRRISL